MGDKDGAGYIKRKLSTTSDMQETAVSWQSIRGQTYLSICPERRGV
jgi:hypothetical protein